MIKINKVIEPEEFSNFKRRNRSYQCWKDYSSSEGKEMKKILKKSMLKEQNNYCPYCERKIEKVEQGHIEHIKPKSEFPALFQDYENLLVSCKTNNTCGYYKENTYCINLFINPVLLNPEEFFSYNFSTGEIEPKDNSDNEKKMAEYTIKTLNLNQKKLADMRRAMIYKIKNMMMGYEEVERVEILNIFTDSDFPTLVNYLIEINFHQLI